MTFSLLFLIKFGVKSVKFNKRAQKCKKISPTQKYEISRAVKADLAAITRIYNAIVLEQNATATLHPVGIEEREAWFDVHEAANCPIYVLREICEGNLTSGDGETFEADDCEKI